VGENLARSTSVVSAADWVAEKQWWNCLANTCSTVTGAQCGHYTQVVWQDTLNVGCSIRQCPDSTNPNQIWNQLVCNYNRVGNFNGKNPFTSPSVTCPRVTKRSMEGSF
jgi:pathogenesis-related protein 1